MCLYGVVLNKHRVLYLLSACEWRLFTLLFICLDICIHPYERTNASTVTCTKNCSAHIIFEIFTAVKIHILFFRVITPTVERNVLPTFSVCNAKNMKAMYVSLKCQYPPIILQYCFITQTRIWTVLSILHGTLEADIGSAHVPKASVLFPSHYKVSYAMYCALADYYEFCHSNVSWVCKTNNKMLCLVIVSHLFSLRITSEIYNFQMYHWISQIILCCISIVATSFDIYVELQKFVV